MRPWGGRRVTALRAAWAARLPLPCPRCDQPVHPWHDWDLGHIIARADRPDLAWDEHNLRPEHAACNRAAGARQVNTRRTGRLRAGW